MRDMMIHGYFSINYEIVWDVARNKIPTLKGQIELLLEEITKE
ncbi:HepT-like ribonuclease domain-containing protein [Lederbergia ruris]|nr:HepT-like ribonuclease domain-containing protein [Lederbergia ruris]